MSLPSRSICVACVTSTSYHCHERKENSIPAKKWADLFNPNLIADHGAINYDNVSSSNYMTMAITKTRSKILQYMWENPGAQMLTFASGVAKQFKILHHFTPEDREDVNNSRWFCLKGLGTDVEIAVVNLKALLTHAHDVSLPSTRAILLCGALEEPASMFEKDGATATLTPSFSVQPSTLFLCQEAGGFTTNTLFSYILNVCQQSMLNTYTVIITFSHSK